MRKSPRACFVLYTALTERSFDVISLDMKLRNFGGKRKINYGWFPKFHRVFLERDSGVMKF